MNRHALISQAHALDPGIAVTALPSPQFVGDRSNVQSVSRTDVATEEVPASRTLAMPSNRQPSMTAEDTSMPSIATCSPPWKRQSRNATSPVANAIVPHHP